MTDDPEAPDTDAVEEPVDDDGDDIENDPSRNPPDELNDLRGA